MLPPNKEGRAQRLRRGLRVSLNLVPELALEGQGKVRAPAHLILQTCHLPGVWAPSKPGHAGPIRTLKGQLTLPPAPQMEQSQN